MFYFTSGLSPAPAKFEAAMDAVIDHAINSQRVVGTTVMVAQAGKLIYQRAAGWADREQNKAMSVDAIYRLASLTKPIVSLTAMRLIEQGDITLDDDITRWLPDFRPCLENGEPATIRVRHLLSHMSGLRYRYSAPADSLYHSRNVSDGIDYQPGLTLEENLQRLAGTRLQFRPGTGWRYSLGIDVLGEIMVRATGKSLPELVNHHITSPLGMADTLFSVRDASRLTTVYTDDNPVPSVMRDNQQIPFGEGAAIFSPGRILKPDAWPCGGGGMAGTALDFMQVLETVRREGAPLITRESFDYMTQEHVTANWATQGPGWGFGVGWALLVDPDAALSPQSAGTLSWSGAYGHTWFVDRQNALCVVAMTNTTPEGVNGQFPVMVRDAVYKGLLSA
ncbi:serine hydrolase domain-containing protein [Pantoea stewartii subsp. indologenes]|uniref:serine hydrolase domain-containing protein n=1 Tax=Pantoea stewartii TaxID=66269 RepID=UPI000541DE18|nr:serine hydrolase domain-containing protein [Pantoea stewartii]KHE02846.1 beta-lactamase [Pantoea stewartii]KHN64719.1 beta-lactamase [Pantoea stewartii]MDF7787280.1 serine hydrolase [Pantoea stewartii]MDK2632943.1 serine hydrolase domain-containing protein [Pantoea stewartii subsp. indologenes]QIE98108.1 beta-lactamase family protein [Pantoea stewartii]